MTSATCSAGIDRRGIDLEVEGAAEGAVDLGLGHDLDQMVVAQPVGDQVGDGGDLQSMALRRRRRGRASRAMVPSSFMISQITPAG